MHKPILSADHTYPNAETPEGGPSPEGGGIIPYLRQPSLSSDGRQIAFCFGGDIWVVGAQGGDARRITAHPSYDEQAIFSPDDATLAFGSQRTGGGNIYLISLIGNGRPKRLTFHRGSSPPYCWSPDGQWIYFCSRHDGISRAIYKVHVEGGTPIRIAGEPHEEYYNVAISPDGKRLAFNNNGDPWWRRGPNPAGHAEIWVVSEKPGAKDYRLLTRYRGRNTYPMWSEDGEGLYFLSDRDGVENIWYMPLRGGDRKARQVTFFKEGRLLRPAISRDGRWIVFERDFRLWILEVASGEAHPVDIRVYVDEKHNPVRHHTFPGFIDEFALAPDGKKVAFIVHGTVFADLANKSDAGVRRANSYRVTEGASRESAVTWEPGSTRIAYLSDRTGHNEIFLYDFKTRQEKQLTDSPESKYLPRFSPDGKWLAYIQGHSEIWLMDTQTEEKRPFITGQTFVGVLRPTEFVWSPDSKWIAFIGTDSNFFSNIYVQHLEEDSPRQITFLSNVDAYNLLWAPNGKFIIFNTGHYRKEHQIARVDLVPIPPKFREEEFDRLFQEESSDSSKPASEPEKPAETPAGEARLEAKSNKSGEATAEKKEDKSAKGEEKKKVEPVEIEFSGIKQRLRFLTDYRLNAKARCIHPNSKVLVFKATMLDEPGLWSLSLEDDESWEMPRQLTTLSYWNGHAEFHHEGKKLYYLNAGRLEIMEMYDDGSRKGYGKTLSTRAELEINFHQQKIQAFNEAWRVIRDYFYDPDYHGCNWDDIYHRFRPIVEGVQTSRDFRELLNLMVGELNASHLGAYGFGSGGADSFLGVDFDRKLLETRGQYKIVHIIPESPLTLPKEPAKVGEYLVAVNDVVLDGRTNLDELLQYKRGKRLVLKLNKRPTLKGAREITVQPIGGYRYEDLRYEEWVVRNSDYVHRRSEGRLGYVHIPGMDYEDYLKFLADLDAETHRKEGVIIDVRYNPGGHVAPFILDVLSRRAYAHSTFRGLLTTADSNIAGSRILGKPVILVTNEHTASDAELFAEGFRRLGLGKIVGTPTAGAVIWTNSIHLLDGTHFRLPWLKVITLEGENIEGKPRPVDIYVERKLGESDRGIDSQLDAAVRELLQQIDGA